jgi:hypothetical protein
MYLTCALLFIVLEFAVWVIEQIKGAVAQGLLIGQDPAHTSWLI